MLEALTALAKIAEMDGSARDLDAELEALPARIGALRRDLATLSSLIERERAALAEAEGIYEERLADLKVRTDALARARSKTGHATKMKELEAAEREVEATRKTLRSREEEIATLRTSIEERRAKLTEHEAQLVEARSIGEAEERSAEVRIAELSAERGGVVEGRDVHVAKVPVPVYRRYERLRERLKTGVSFVDSELCNACHRTLPTQLYTKVVKHEEAVECPFCHRFVIHVSLRD